MGLWDKDKNLGAIVMNSTINCLLFEYQSLIFRKTSRSLWITGSSYSLFFF